MSKTIKDARQLHQAGISLFGIGQHALADESWSQALAVCDALPEKPHGLMALLLRNRAGVAMLRQQYLTAGNLYLRALPLFETIFGSNHWQVALTQNDLAAAYVAQGFLEMARACLVTALNPVPPAGKPDESVVILLGSSLSSVLFLQGQYTPCAVINAKVLEAAQRLLGDEHEITQTCRNNLAVALKKLGRHQEASDLLTVNQQIQNAQRPDLVLN